MPIQFDSLASLAQIFTATKGCDMLQMLGILLATLAVRCWAVSCSYNNLKNHMHISSFIICNNSIHMHIQLSSYVMLHYMSYIIYSYYIYSYMSCYIIYIYIHHMYIHISYIHTSYVHISYIHVSYIHIPLYSYVVFAHGLASFKVWVNRARTGLFS